MNIKRYKHNINLLKNGGKNMVVSLAEYRNRIDDDPSIKISLADMLFDKEKRNAIYKHYDKKYVSTKEEDEIYNEMRQYYSREKEQ